MRGYSLTFTASIITGDANVLADAIGFNAILWSSATVNIGGNTKSVCPTTQPIRGPNRNFEVFVPLERP